jgi:5-methylcytosine-specific restriction endonuclease McrA
MNIPASVVRKGLIWPYDRKGLFGIDEVLSQITQGYVRFGNDRINMWDQRYRVFQGSLECCRCGLKGMFFAKERSAKLIREPGQRRSEGIMVAVNEGYHFNLYALRRFDQNNPDRRLDVLMTKDHIIPRSKGGPDTMDNYRTMCSPCNNKRGNKDDDQIQPPTHRRNHRHRELTVAGPDVVGGGINP